MMIRVNFAQNYLKHITRVWKICSSNSHIQKYTFHREKFNKPTNSLVVYVLIFRKFAVHFDLHGRQFVTRVYKYITTSRICYEMRNNTSRFFVLSNDLHCGDGYVRSINRERAEHVLLSGRGLFTLN